MDNRELLCDSCGKNMQTLDGRNTMIGASITINVEEDQDTGYIQRMMGPFEIGRTYNVCLECWLRSLGIKDTPI